MMKPSHFALLAAYAAQQVQAYNGTRVGAAQCCSALSEIDSLSGKVIYPNATLYEVRLESYYSANAALAPWCMVLPEATENVAEVARVIYQLQCPFGMRSGGHSAFTGASSVKNGITIDFGYMNSTTYDSATGIASIQPGSDWGMVYDKLETLNVTVAGGRADVVGVGGFTMGGGYSFHSGRVGWACDNVHNFEVVLANGSVVNANATANADLFQAMKGSSGNLGLVTRYDMYTIEDPNIWGGLVTYNWTDRAAVFNAYQSFADNFAEDPASQVLTVMEYSDKELILCSILTNSEANVAPPAFDNYTAIANTSDATSVGSIAVLVPEFTGATPTGVYSNWFSGSVANSFAAEMQEFMYATITTYAARMEAAITHNSSLSMVANMQPVPRTFVDHSAARGGNVLGLEALVPDDGAPLAAWLYSVTVTEQADQPPVFALAVELVAALEAKADALAANKNWHYLNYAHRIQDPIAGYGNASVAKIRAASARYDPEGVFQNLRHSGFKIPS